MQSQLIKDTFACANLKPIDVHYVEAHGTGTGVCKNILVYVLSISEIIILIGG